MRALLPLTVFAVLLLPGVALAAPAKISPRAAGVSKAGVAKVEVANPNRYVLRGTATVAAGRSKLARRTVRLGALSVSTLALRFDQQDLTHLRHTSGRATMTLRLRRSGGRTTTARRKLTLRLPSTAPQNPGGPSTPTPPADSNSGGADGTPPASNRWVGRMGTDGAYDDFEFTVEGGQMQITRPTTVPVYCFENGGSHRSALSFELFDAPGPWILGTDGVINRQGIAVNQLVHGGERAITYKVTGATQAAGRISGSFGMSFSDSRYDPFTNTISFINCSGTQSFEAVPAG